MENIRAAKVMPLPRRPQTPEPAVPLFQFLRKPYFDEHPQAHLSWRRWMAWLCLIWLICAIADVIADDLLIHIFGWEVPANTFLQYISYHPSWIAFFAILVAPITEELGFRAFLSTNSKAVFVGLAFFMAYMYELVSGDAAHMTGHFAIVHYFSHVWVLAPASVVSLLLYLYARRPILTFFRRHGAWVFWLSCIVFGAMHAADFTDKGVVWWDFVLALPQFCLGVGVAYLRVAFGLRWSILTHCAFDWVLSAMGWGLVAVASDRIAKLALSIAVVAVVLCGLIFGVVVLARVLRQRW